MSAVAHDDAKRNRAAYPSGLGRVLAAICCWSVAVLLLGLAGLLCGEYLANTTAEERLFKFSRPRVFMVVMCPALAALASFLAGFNWIASPAGSARRWTILSASLAFGCVAGLVWFAL